MNATTRKTLVERGREAAGRGDWPEAHDLLARADQDAPLGGPDLALLADAAYAAGRPEVTLGTWERAHARALRAGDRGAAAGAAVRVALHLLLDTGLMAPVRGWIGRAERLLPIDQETPAHAWLAVVGSYERLLSGDLRAALEGARRAVTLGTRCDPAAAALGRVAEARCLILAGEVSSGVSLLNEAAVAAVSGELDPVSTGIVYCEVVCGFQALALYDLAEEWTAAMEGWRHGQPVGSIHGRCRVHRAEILRLRGFCPQAEEEALLACQELRPYLRRELGWPLTELGRIRLRRGDLAGAEEAFGAAHQAGWDPQPGLALLHLARGEEAMAVRSIRDALEHPPAVPSKELPPNTELRRAPLLEAQVEIEIAGGDLALARHAADQLAGIAASFGSRALVAGATAAAARVRLAAGDAAGARLGFEQAIRLWSEIDAPFEAAVARMGLGRAHRAAGSREGAMREFAVARAVFERVGAVRHAAEAAREVDRVDDRSGVEPRRSSAAAPPAGGSRGNVFRHEGDYWLLTFEGRTLRLRSSKGLHYLARLLAEPAREIHVLDLVGGCASGGSGPSSPPPGGDFRLDGPARDAYRRRLQEIDEDLEEAHELGNEERAAQAEAERDFLVRELSRAVGLGGRDRRMGSASERARASVTRAIRQAMTRIRTQEPGLGQHLDLSIRTGTFCAYLPVQGTPPVWAL